MEFSATFRSSLFAGEPRDRDAALVNIRAILNIWHPRWHLDTDRPDCKIQKERARGCSVAGTSMTNGVANITNAK